MKRHLTLVALALLGLWPTLHAQTPPPTPKQGEIWNHGNFEHPARIADARAVIADPATPPDVSMHALTQMDHLILDDASPASWPAGDAALAKQIIDAQGQVTPNTPPEVATGLLGKAIVTTARLAYKTNRERVAYLRPFVVALTGAETGEYPVLLRQSHATTTLDAARDAIASGKLADALAYASDPLLVQTNQWRNQIGLVADIKSRQRSPEALGYAKLVYLLSDFGRSQEGIRAVTTALRSLDRSLARANAFIASQTDRAQPNLLRDVALPEAYRAGLPDPLAAQAPLVDQVIRGDAAGALATAMEAFSQADSNDALNAAVAGVARTLRDVDQNLARANAFVAAQQKGESFPIAELQ